MGKRVLITLGVQHPCPLLSSWYFYYMRLRIPFQGNKSPLMTILNLQGWPCFLSRATFSLVKRAKTAIILIYYLYQIFWQGGSAIL